MLTVKPYDNVRRSVTMTTKKSKWIPVIKEDFMTWSEKKTGMDRKKTTKRHR